MGEALNSTSTVSDNSWRSLGRSYTVGTDQMPTCQNNKTNKQNPEKPTKLSSICAPDDTTEFQSSVVITVSHLGEVCKKTVTVQYLRWL